VAERVELFEEVIDEGKIHPCVAKEHLDDDQPDKLPKNDFDSLLKMHDDVKFMKIKNSASILNYFASADSNEENAKFVLKHDMDDEKYNWPRRNISSTTVCTYALSQYIKIWESNGSWKKKKGKSKKYLVGDIEFFDINSYYNYIIGQLWKFFAKSKDEAAPKDMGDIDIPDEFTLLNTLSWLKLISKECKNLEANDEPVIKHILTQLKPYEQKLLELHYHPFYAYTYLYILRQWNEDDFNRIFEEFYEKGKYELYRQMALYRANDHSLFDTKRLIYSLLIVTMKNRYSNSLMIDDTLKVIFKKQFHTGLWPIGQVVKPHFIAFRAMVRVSLDRRRVRTIRG
jgi:hypothetical protein